MTRMLLAVLCLTTVINVFPPRMGAQPLTIVGRYTFEAAVPGTNAPGAVIADTSGATPPNNGGTVGQATKYLALTPADGATGKIGFQPDTGGGFQMLAVVATRFTGTFLVDMLVRPDGPETNAEETFAVLRDGNTISWHILRRPDGKVELDLFGQGTSGNPKLVSTSTLPRGMFLRLRASYSTMEGKNYLVLTLGEEIYYLPTTAIPITTFNPAFTPRLTIGNYNPGLRICACTFDEVTVSLGSLLIYQPEVSSISSAASGLAGATPGGWTSVYGKFLQPLGPGARSWAGTDFRGDAQPTALDGSSVCFGAKCSPLAYVSNGQLNILTPSNIDTPAGQDATATIQTPLGKATFKVPVRKRSPAFFPIAGKYVAAVHLNGTVVAANGTFPGAVTLPALPGEVVLIFGTGFGPVATTPSTETVYATASPLNVPFSVRLDGVLVAPENVLFAGRSAGHLDQVNLRLPADLGPGDHELRIEVEGFVSPEKIYISVGSR